MTDGSPAAGRTSLGSRDGTAPPSPTELQGELLDQLPVAVVTADVDGTITRWNRHAEELFGWRATDVLGRDGREMLALATDSDDAAGIVDGLRNGMRWEGEITVRRRDRRRVSVYVATSPLHDAQGRLAGSLAIALDITPRVRAERQHAEALRREQAARAEAELLHRIATAASGEEDLVGILSAALDRLGRLMRFTGGSIALVDGEELVLRAAVGPFASDSIGQRLPRGSGQSWRIIESGEAWMSDDLVEAGFHIRGIPAEEGPRSYLAVPLVWHGETVGLLQVDSTQPRAFRQQDRSLLEAVAVALSGPIEIARRREAERQALAESEVAQARLAFLAEASQILASSLDYPETLAAVARLAIPRLADYCIVDVVEGDDELLQVAVAHRDPGKEESLRELRRRYPFETDSPIGAAHVLATGEPEVQNEIDPAWLERAARDAEHRRLIEELRFTAYMIVPLVARGRTVGAFSFVSTEPGRQYDWRDVALAEDLARRAAAAIDTARLTSELEDFRSTVDLTHEGVFMFDPGTLRYFYANEGAVELTGYGREELLGMTPLDLKPEFDEERLRGLLEPLIDGTSSSAMVTTTQRRKDGGLISVELLMQHVRPEGERGRVVTIARDISDRIEARARLQRLAESERARNAELRAIIRAMGDAVMVVQHDGSVSMANPAAEALFPEATIATYEELRAHFDDPEGLAPEIGQGGRYGPVEIRLGGDLERWVEISAYPVFTPSEALAQEEDERVLETILFMRDVTEQRRTRQMRDAFISVLSHELRTPVTTIYGNSKLLGRSDRDLDLPTRRDVFTDIEVESERLYRLVEDLLVLARFGEGEARLGREPLLLQRVVPIVARSERARWPATTFTTEIAPGIPTVQGDPTYVEQVIRNLISNAAKYGGDGGRVTIALDAEARDVRLRVLDEGPGFTSEEASQLFELFYRAPGTATKASGAGIGLFVCKRLIEEMGGRIWARPRPEGGAEFGFSLPVFSEESE
ncbi:MAG TPA: PAS domain S-box protein [Candidatus Limnocylindrales bacterium]|nr:PAS domain S-box protein [Candidatus Limnocylindrales bacterium]